MMSLIKLPGTRKDSDTSVEKALSTRRSIREYHSDPLSLQEISQLLWSAYGITSDEGFRTAPSAMAAYPLELYVNATAVEGLDPGLYHYLADGHSLEKLIPEDRREALFASTFDQKAVQAAPAILIFSAVYERTCAKLGEAGRDHVHMDLGHAGENVHLQAVALGLGTVVIGAFRPPQAREVLGLPEDETPLYLMPVGRPA